MCALAARIGVGIGLVGAVSLVTLALVVADFDIVWWIGIVVVDIFDICLLWLEVWIRLWW